MLDHVTLKIRDLAVSIAFYDAALQPLGIRRLYDEPGACAGYGKDSKFFFWIGVSIKAFGGTHVAFSASDHDAVDAFYSAAMAGGGQDNGKPGPRPHYDAHYYGAFVFDPDGHNIEAVCRQPT